jgi:hypothetical protein
MQDSKNNRSRWIYPAVLAGVLLVIYLRTLLPGTGYHPDTAKFQFVGYILGIPHAPGYPTYTVVNHLFTHIFPFGTVAYRANLLSALFAIACCMMFFKILRFLELPQLLAFAVSLALGLTRTFWSQAIVAEVYSLNALFVTLVLYFFLKWNRSLSTRDLLFGCAFYAFSFGHHLTMITLLPAVVWLVLITDKRIFLNPKIVLTVLAFIVLGALQYSYLLWRTHDPTALFLDLQTPDVHRLIYAVTGAHFKPKMFAFTAAEVFTQRIPMFLKLLWRELLVFIPIVVIGMIRVRNRAVNVFLLLTILGALTFALNYDIPDIFTYFIPVYMILMIYLAIGMNFIVDRQVFGRSLISLSLLLPVCLLVMNFAAVDQHSNRGAEEARELLKAAGKNGVVFGRGQDLPRMYFLYYLYGEGLYRNNLYVLRYTPEFVRSYMIRNRPFRYRELRKDVPPGLDVYCTTPGQKRSLEDLGFQLVRVREGLYKVTKNRKRVAEGRA